MNQNKENNNCRFFPACGGCAYLNVEEEKYRQNKISDLQKTLSLLPVKDSIDFFWIGPHSRRRIILQIDAKNNLGFFAKSSRELVTIDACYVAEKPISALIPQLQNFIKSIEENLLTQISITLFDNVIDVIFSVRREFNFAQMQKVIEFARALKINVSSQIKNNLTPIFIFFVPSVINEARDNPRILPTVLELNPSVFLQATKSGAEKISSLIIEFIKNKFGDRKIFAADIYGGFGAYSFAVAEHVREIHVFEGDEKMVQLIAKNAQKNSLSSKIKGEIRDLFFSPLSAKELEKFDLAIINPPRNGAGPQALEIAKSKLQNLIYVSCNPQSFMRDAKILCENGYKIRKITAIDQFFSSPHLELFAIFTI